MIYPMVLFPVTLSDPEPKFQGHGDAIDVLCAQLTRDLFAIAKFLQMVGTGWATSDPVEVITFW